jgi:hypothetical protein
MHAVSSSPHRRSAYSRSVAGSMASAAGYGKYRICQETPCPAVAIDHGHPSASDRSSASPHTK